MVVAHRVAVQLPHVISDLSQTHFRVSIIGMGHILRHQLLCDFTPSRILHTLSAFVHRKQKKQNDKLIDLLLVNGRYFVCWIFSMTKEHKSIPREVCIAPLWECYLFVG